MYQQAIQSKNHSLDTGPIASSTAHAIVISPAYGYSFVLSRSLSSRRPPFGQLKRIIIQSSSAWNVCRRIHTASQFPNQPQPRPPRQAKTTHARTRCYVCVAHVRSSHVTTYARQHRQLNASTAHTHTNNNNTV